MQKYTNKIAGFLTGLLLGVPLLTMAVIGSGGSIGSTQFFTTNGSNGFGGTSTTTSIYAPTNYDWAVGTTTSVHRFGITDFAIYGSSTAIQTPFNTRHAFVVVNSASSTIFRVNTVLGSINIDGTGTSTAAGGFNLTAGCFSINDTCVGGGAVVTGSGSANQLAFWDSATSIAGDTDFTINGATGLLTVTALSTTNSTSTNATSTSLNVSGQVDFDTLTSAIVLTGAGGILAEYAGTSCTNQFVRSLSALGAATCATVVATDVDLADLTATDGTLTFSGTYDGQAARTIGLNLSNANTWTALQTFSGGFTATNGTTTNATSTSLNVSGQVDFDGLTSALIQTGAGGILAEYAGTSCTNQFPRSLSALGAATCATVVDADVDNALTISGGTVNNSPIGATTPHTGAFTTLSNTGLLSLFGNLTGTSTIDFSGGVFRGVASSSLTTTASGQSGVDTTSGQFRWTEGNQTKVAVATTSPVFAVSSTTLAALGAFGEGAGTSTFKLAGIWSAYTINELFCSVMGTSTSIGSAVRFGDGSASTSFANANTAGALTVLSSNNSFTRYENSFVEIGSAVNSPDLVTCSANRTYNSD